MAGPGTSVIFVPGLQLLGAGPVASWCGIVCVKSLSGGGKFLRGSIVRFGPHGVSHYPKVGEEVGNGRARNVCNFRSRLATAQCWTCGELAWHCLCEVTQWWWQVSAGVQSFGLDPMVFHITPKLERRSEMAGPGTSVTFVPGLQLLGAG